MAESAFVRDDGEQVTQEIYENSGLAASVATEVQSVFSSFDEDIIAQSIVQCAYRLLGANSSTLTERRGEWFYSRATCYQGAVYPEQKGRQIPQTSISTLIAQTGKPVYWSTGGKNQLTEWLSWPNFFGVPVFDDDDELVGSLVVSYKEPPESLADRVFILEVLAAAWYKAHKNACTYRASLRKGRIIEQERIAQELHETAAQNLFSVGMKVTSLLQRDDLSSDLHTQLADLASMVNTANANLRAVAFADVEEEHQVSPVLELIDEEITAHLALGGVKVTPITSAPIEPTPEIYSVIKIFIHEALLNIRKHAHASMATLSYSLWDGTIHLSVQDDGVGAAAVLEDQGEPGLHFGLENLHRLVAALGGTFSIQSTEEGYGTALIARIPLKGGRDA
ncbi:MAG: histidine kinase [Coriobacteriales bacterium]|jgi:signal transduction histidine kinase|nr:histidine kinase [Coriobacteriales bacterium]